MNSKKRLTLKEMRKQGGKNSRKYMTKEEVKKIARKAARARWKKYRQEKARLATYVSLKDTL